MYGVILDLLDKVLKLENDAEAFGFKWENAEQIMQQIQSECLEIEEHLHEPSASQARLQEEIGDLLHAVLSLCVFCKMSPKETLDQTLNKFERRYLTVKHLAQLEGKSTLIGQSFEELMHFWDKAKTMVG